MSRELQNIISSLEIGFPTFESLPDEQDVKPGALFYHMGTLYTRTESLGIIPVNGSDGYGRASYTKESNPLNFSLQLDTPKRLTRQGGLFELIKSNHFTLEDDRFVCQRPGVYMIQGHVTFDGRPEAVITLDPRKNDQTICPCLPEKQFVNKRVESLWVSELDYFEEEDTLSFWVTNIGNNQNMDLISAKMLVFAPSQNFILSNGQ